MVGLGIAGIGLLMFGVNWTTKGEKVFFNPQYDREYSALEATRSKGLGLNTDIATTWVRYRDRDHGVAFDIPYNPAWGNETFSISPFWNFYDEHGNEEVQFGPMVRLGSPCEPEGCMRLRSTMLTMLPLKGDQKPLNFEEIKKYYAEHPEAYANVEGMELNGIRMIKYAILWEGDDCLVPTIGIIGEKEYDYRLRIIGCSINTKQDFEYLEEIAKTIRLL